MARSKRRQWSKVRLPLGLLLLALSWAAALDAIPSSSIGAPPTLAGASGTVFLWHLIARLNDRNRYCAAPNRREYGGFCRNRAGKNQISCKAFPEHTICTWRQRWEQERPEEPVPTFAAELRRRLKSRDVDLPEADVVDLYADWELSSLESAAAFGTGVSFASAPITFALAALL
jgi:hypothetical protein